jgi:hypothetical protein
MRELIFEPRFRLHGDAKARRTGRHVTAIPDDHGIEKMLMKMVDIFQDSVLERSGKADIVEHCVMLNVFAQSNSAGMKTNRNAELCSHQHNREHFIHPAQSAGVGLAKPNGSRLEELFEDDSVLALFPGRYSYGRFRSQPISSRTMVARRMSSSISAPTFIFMWFHPWASACLHKSRSFSSE